MGSEIQTAEDLWGSSFLPEAEHPPRPSTRSVEDLERVGGSLALDFANTVGGTRIRPVEHLSGWERLLRWAVAAGAVDESDVGVLADRVAADPAGAEAAYLRALELREAIYRIFDAVARERAPAVGDLTVLNARLGAALSRLELVRGEDGFVYAPVGPADSFDRLLDPIVRDAAELLVSSHLDRIKQCGGHDCSWLFVDASRNRGRRWCDMADCGNRAKARRHYRKHRDG
ncbi:MAG TPA: ABATE domain-containing protein [Gemmatimonadota bacterium]|nr:ABATE domain-containing protein [Gemmatimonadota bacterium]